MDGLFGFFGMADDYEERKVARHEDDDTGLFVDTCRVNDSEQDYETAIEHPVYNDGKIVIVETYATKELARVGHDKWLRIMTSDKLPDRLFDVSTAAIKQFGEILGLDYSEGFARQD